MPIGVWLMMWWVSGEGGSGCTTPPFVDLQSPTLRSTQEHASPLSARAVHIKASQYPISRGVLFEKLVLLCFVATEMANVKIIPTGQ